MVTYRNQKERNAPPVLLILLAVLGSGLLYGCVSDQIDPDQPELTDYQEQLVQKAPEKQLRQFVENMEPAAAPTEKSDIVHLSVEDAVASVLVNNPQISVVSFDPSIAQEEITQSVSAFDPVFFSEFNYEDQDDPTDSIFGGGQAESKLWESGIRQRSVTGAEWSLGYAFTRTTDDLTTRELPTRYEPIATFQIRQPLLRDGWQGVNLAGVNIAKLNYSVALASFRQEAEAVTVEMISYYWTLKQARRNREIQQKLLDHTQQALQRVRDRQEIDASLAQIKQAETAFNRRKVVLRDIERQLNNVQYQLIRLLADSQTGLTDGYEIIPTANFTTNMTVLDSTALLRTAKRQNPAVIRANRAVEIAQINVDAAKHQRMPKLDLVASTRVSGLDDSFSGAQDVLSDGDYASYTVGVTLEVPLDNRQRKAEYRKRMLERSKAHSQQWNISGQVAVAVKDAIQAADTAFDQYRIQQDAIESATAYLQALEDTEVIRQQLTPEFLLLKLQAQEALADALRGETESLTDYNIALVRLSQATGTVLDMRYVKNAMPQQPPRTDSTEMENGLRIHRLREAESSNGEEQESSDSIETEEGFRIHRLGGQ